MCVLFLSKYISNKYILKILNIYIGFFHLIKIKRQFYSKGTIL